METETKWTKMTPEEKREERFRRWLEAPGVEFKSPEAKKAYQERVTRLVKVIKLEEPDRVPCMLPVGSFAVHYAGSTTYKVMYDSEEARRVWKKFRQDFETDTSMGAGVGIPASVMDRMDYKLMKWPGHGLSTDSTSMQFIEGEYMKADEYDVMLDDPSDFWLRTMLPRTVGALEPFKYLNQLNPMVGMPMSYIMPFARKDVQAAFRALMDAAEEMMESGKMAAEIVREELTSGYPPFAGGMSAAPFDMVGDSLRGTHGIIMDMYRQPDKLLEVLERVTPWAIKLATSVTFNALSPVIMMPLHKGDDTFMSDQQFETFYWPTLKKVMMGLIEEGLVPMPFAEGFYNRRLRVIKDMPRCAVIWYFERSDMFKAKEVLGDTSCIAGNVPVSLLSTGTPEEVKEYCRKLIEVCGKGGGYILAAASSVEKGNPDSIRAMMEAAKAYGTYK